MMMKNTNEYEWCRLTKYGTLNVKDFNQISCMQCYNLLIFVIQDFLPKLNTTDYYFITNDNHSLDPNDDLDEISKLMRPIEYDKWRECCNEAKYCCKNMVENKIYSHNDLVSSINITSSKICKSIWDGWSCHQNTQAGYKSQVSCPSHHIEDTCHTILGN